MARRKPPPGPDDVEAAVERILAEERVVWFPVKHFSPACAWHVRRLIEEVQPAAVLVEGPDDADPLIPHIVSPATRPPLTILSAYADRRNRFGLNGRQTPSEDVPARFRSWWPFTDFCPEYNALTAGAAAGAALHFIDLPLTARVPFQHARTGRSSEAPDDHHLGLSRYFEALRLRERKRSFDELWDGHFEVGGLHLSREDFTRRVLTFAWCARYAGGAGPDDVDGTLTREAHMRYHVDRVLKAHPEGRVVVVTGAFHSVALPFTKRKRAKVFKDSHLETLVVAHSFQALARLYSLERLPAYGQAVWEALVAEEPRPYDAAAMRMLVEVMREARGRQEGPSTADAVAAWKAARRLAELRGNAEVTLHDLLDAAQMSYVKGDRRLLGGAVERAAREVLVGRAHGEVTDAAGQVPLLADFYARCKAHRLDVTGEAKTVRLDLHKQRKHRLKSAVLHQCDFLEVPFFGELESHGGHFRGPDPATGTNLHLITETWAVRWTEVVDDRLLELADRGATLAEAAAVTLREQLAEVTEDAAIAARLLLRCAQMMLVEHFDATLDVVETAIAEDRRLVRLVDALADFVLLHSHRDALATRGDERVLETVQMLFVRAALALPAAAYVESAEQGDVLDRVQTLVRIALTFEAAALDVDLLVQQVHALVDAPDGRAGVRGAGFGVLYGFGALRERDIATELLSYLRGPPDKVLDAGAFLEGLFLTSRGVFLRSRRLLRTVNEVLAELDWDVFKTLLPDLRRAFTLFTPSEIDEVARHVAEEVCVRETRDADAPVPPELAAACARIDTAVAGALEGWW